MSVWSQFWATFRPPGIEFTYREVKKRLHFPSSPRGASLSSSQWPFSWLCSWSSWMSARLCCSFLSHEEDPVTYFFLIAICLSNLWIMFVFHWILPHKVSSFLDFLKGFSSSRRISWIHLFSSSIWGVFFFPVSNPPHLKSHGQTAVCGLKLTEPCTRLRLHSVTDEPAVPTPFPPLLSPRLPGWETSAHSAPRIVWRRLPSTQWAAEDTVRH